MVCQILKEAVGGETSHEKGRSFSKLKVGELREKLSEQGLSTTGTKPFLVARLKEALQGHQGCGFSASIAGTLTKAVETPGRARRSKKLSESQTEPALPASLVKTIKQETSRASTPVRRSRRLSGILDCPVAIETPLQKKSRIETISEVTEDKQAVEIPGDPELGVTKEQSQPAEAPAQKPEENIPMEKRLNQLFASKSIPRQKPKSGKFWKGERTPFRQIKRGRGKRHWGQKTSFEQRLKMKKEKLRKRSGENKTTGNQVFETQPN